MNEITTIEEYNTPSIKNDELKAVIARILLFSPRMSILQLQKQLNDAENGFKVDIRVLTKVVNQIREERTKRISEQTKEDVIATMEELVEFVANQLRAIAQEERLTYLQGVDGKDKQNKPEVRVFAQQNRIRALNGIIENYEKLTKLKMDLGVLERKLGTGDVNIRAILWEIKQEREGKLKNPNQLEDGSEKGN